jgi:hypothetical protein
MIFEVRKLLAFFISPVFIGNDKTWKDHSIFWMFS